MLAQFSGTFCYGGGVMLWGLEKTWSQVFVVRQRVMGVGLSSLFTFLFDGKLRIREA